MARDDFEAAAQQGKASLTCMFLERTRCLERTTGFEPATHARQWLETRGDLEDTTRAKYQGLLRLHVLPAFGSHRIAHIDPAAVRAWYHALAAKYKSTGDDAYRLLRAIMNTAVGDKRIGPSPCTVKGAGSTESAKRPIADYCRVPGRRRRPIAPLPGRVRPGRLVPAEARRGAGVTTLPCRYGGSDHKGRAGVGGASR